jgi:geranylgeranyl diphosphate synthase type II
MRHAVLGGGKRVRPQLLVLVAESCSREPWSAPVLQMVTLAGCAVEMIHSASLIHDDLPAFDDAPLRRGKPTVHVLFGEPIAILAGDALIALAFEMLSTGPIELSVRILRIVNTLALAIGSCQGLTGGQSLETEVAAAPVPPKTVRRKRSRRAPEPDLLERYHAMKTGALFRAASEAGACAVGVTDTTAWQRLGHSIGLAFQLADDLCDVFSRPEIVQKPVRRDAALGRPNAVLWRGEAEVRRKLVDLLDESRFLVKSAAIEPARMLAWIDHLDSLLSGLSATASRP